MDNDEINSVIDFAMRSGENIQKKLGDLCVFDAGYSLAGHTIRFGTILLSERLEHEKTRIELEKAKKKLRDLGIEA